jgi:hypothetical protein
MDYHYKKRREPSAVASDHHVGDHDRFYKKSNIGKNVGSSSVKVKQEFRTLYAYDVLIKVLQYSRSTPPLRHMTRQTLTGFLNWQNERTRTCHVGGSWPALNNITSC